MPTGSEIINRAGTLLNDTEHTRWRCPELCDWINEGVRAIVLAKPSANAATILLKLVGGTKQTINPFALYPPPIKDGYAGGSYALVLLDVMRNVNTTYVSTTVGVEGVVFPNQTGRAIKRVDRALLEAQVPEWHNPTKVQFQKEVRNYTFDEQVPTEFYVYPGNNGTGYVQAQAGLLPKPIKAIIPVPNPNAFTANSSAVYNQQVGLPEPYSVPLLDYVLYRCQMKDDIDGAAARSAMHYQQFATAIGMKIQVEAAHSPNARR